MIIRNIASSLTALFTRLSSKSTTIAGTESVYLDDAGTGVKAALSDAIRYGGGNSTRVTTIGNANIHQKSDGTMWLEVTGQTAGNARGAGAFDWQAVRGASDAAKVASGTGAFAFGTQCTASGSYSVAMGIGAVASATEAVAFGRGLAQGSNSFASVTGDASGAQAVALGAASRASGRNAVALGARCLAENLNQIAMSGPESLTANSGQAQANIQTFYHATTDASATVLSINNTVASRMVIPAMRACAITGVVTAMSDATDGYKVKAWEIKCVITRDNSNNTRIVGTPIITELGADTEAASWAITSITADNTNESLAITVTGEAATNIRFQASLFYSQVGH